MSLALFTLAAAGLASALSESAPVVLTKSGEYIEGYEAVMAYSKVPSAVLAIWEKDLATGKVSSSLYDSDFTVLTKYACGNTVDSPELGLEVTFALDDTANGHLTIAGVKYTLEADPELTGGISCSRLFNDGLAVAECYLPVSGVITARDLPSLAGNGTTECFDGDVTSENLFGTVYEQIEGDDFDPESSLHERENGEKVKRESYLRSRIVGNGSPHKWRRHLTTTQLVCSSSQGCTATHVVGRTITHAANFGITGVPWISAGYSVSASWSTSNSYSCPGGKGEVTCVKNRRYHQGYRIEGFNFSERIGVITKKSAPFELRSPVKPDSRGPSPSQLDGFYCVVNSCRGEGYVHWENQGPGVHNAAK